MPPNRVRVVKGSCWSCKKRRIKCSLSKPACRQCVSVGANCDYNSRLIRWSTRPTPHVPVAYCIPRNDLHLTVYLEVCERRALDYFHLRVWPLLSTAEEPCAPPSSVVLEHRVVLLAACLLSDSHRLLQDGTYDHDTLGKKRLECLAAVRAEIDRCSAEPKGNGLMIGLLFAVILLYFDDGYMGCILKSASTSSHYHGILAILGHLGGIEAVVPTAPEPLRMLLSEFATTDLTTSMVQGKPPAFPPDVWDLLDQGPVWWGRDPLSRCSLAAVFREIAEMGLFLQATTSKAEELSIDRIRAFEAALRPVYAPLTIADSDGRSPSEASDCSFSEAEAVHAFTLVRIFQHTALLYLYRAICGLPTRHPLVQQHVKSCLACIFEIPREANNLNCVVFPLFIAGAHVSSLEEQKAVLGMADVIYNDMRFASIEAVKSFFKAVWPSDSGHKAWLEIFSHLSPHVLVL
ncbi:hypothetical protein CORC01_09863 [Colletotrichum orchidophilum]|uniref:Zn(2)-C6 fungal-type domain-containing protein n=1 Tax=Colletotrichum orchidophilum TaxID=1209926 RepID=A0A1G4B0I1_9PEZI|nr:uncharacterized protein CORC01_09863 [Colletotrichum orchidophilum]OHE94845.1 hypothetical protein CORC01_09863 [Colletotrichum orchidophilum]